MKRSEMLTAIRQELEGKPIQYDYAEEILATVEKLGMLPPIEPGRTVYDLDLGVPEWEDE